MSRDTVINAFLGGAQLSPAQRARLMDLAARARMLAARDRLDYQAALAEAKVQQPQPKVQVKQLKRLRRICEIFQGDDPWPPQGLDPAELVRDLLDNAERCQARGRYEDAAGRLYRATELLAQLRLRSAHGLRTGDVKTEGLNADTAAWLEERRPPGGPIRIGSMMAYELLERLGDPLGAYWRANLEHLRGYLEKRNLGVSAHGLKPVNREDWLGFGERWVKWVEGAIASVAQ